VISLKEILDKLASFEDLHFGEKVEKLNELKKVHGPLLEDAVIEHVKRQTESEWNQLKYIHPRHTAEELIDLQWEHVSRSAGIEFTINQEDNGISVNTTKCPLADMANQLQASHWGYLYYCSRSQVAVNTFNPDIKFSRTKTLMLGDECCNHCYKKK
jgi:hypothetical protein